jgi:hypothetical protein
VTIKLSRKKIRPSQKLGLMFLQLFSYRYCTVRLIVLVAMAPPLALLAVTTTAEAPAGVPVTVGVCVDDVLLPPQPASTSKAIPAKAVASRIFGLRFLISPYAIAVRPSNTKNICGGTPVNCGAKTADRAVVAIVSVTGVTPVAVTELGLKLQVAAAGKPEQAKVTAPKPPA